jgi:S1-C subfamily serine protease
MDITTRLEFAAPPDEVFTMLVDQRYLDEVCRATESRSYEATVTGSTTLTRRSFPAPAAVARFTGGELTVSEQTAWGEAAADGSRTGDLVMDVQGQPVSLRGELRLGPGGTGTVVELTGDLKVAIPLLGKKLEQSTAPAVLAGFRKQQEVGDRWLTR